MKSASILARLKATTVIAPSSTGGKTRKELEMTPLQIEQCRTALRSKNRGFNVQPNQWNIEQPYRVSINYNNKWENYGNFSNVHTAAAIGSLVAVAFFGSKAKRGEYDEDRAANDPAFQKWLEDPRNAIIVKQATGELPAVNEGGSVDGRGFDGALPDVNAGMDEASDMANPFADDDEPATTYVEQVQEDAKVLTKEVNVFEEEDDDFGFNEEI